jgi:hypothetical protein
MKEENNYFMKIIDSGEARQGWLTDSGKAGSTEANLRR